MEKIRCAIYRGGTSRGIFLHSDDIPEDRKAQDRLALALMGSPDIRQIDGLGGATSHTSKIAVISRSTYQETDIDYHFIQVAVDRPMVDRSGMCGNLLSAAGLFAVDEGLVKIEEPVTVVRIRNINTEKSFQVHIPVKSGRSVVSGDYKIAGVPKAGAYIRLDFIDPSGSITGELLPTHYAQDEIHVDGQKYVVSLVDASNPMVFSLLSDFSLQGTETIPQLNSNPGLLSLFEKVRAECAYLFGFVKDPSKALDESPALPRLCLIGPPIGYLALDGSQVQGSELDITCRMLSMQRVHQSFAVTGAVCLATAAMIKDTIPNGLLSGLNGGRLRIGHPSGVMEVEVEGRVEGKIEEGLDFRGCISLGRTARRLMEGFAYVTL